MKNISPVKLGVAPVRRNDAYFPDCLADGNKAPLFDKLASMGLDWVDIDDVCHHGVMATLADMQRVKEKFLREKVEALFLPNVTFGAEDAAVLLAKALRVPVLLWGPRDPDGRGATGKPGLGIYTISKSLRRLGIPFTFMGSCDPTEPLFERGLRTFLAAARIVREVQNTRILQIGQRPESFWSVIVDEGLLLERFGVQVYPLSLPELFEEFENVAATQAARVAEVSAALKTRTNIRTNESIVEKSAIMNVTLERLCERTNSNAIAIQCWHELPKMLGIWPCAGGALLAENGIPMACEGDVYGAVSSVIAQAASEINAKPLLFDFDFVHPQNPNAFNVHHCAACPIESYAHKPDLFRRPVPADKDWGGCISGELKTSGKVSFLRFDGDNGAFSVLVGNGTATSGPAASNGNSYGWYEVRDWPQLEHILVTGPYIHHGVIIYDDILPAVYEASKYLGFTVEFAFEEEEKAAKRFMYTI